MLVKGVQGGNTMVDTLNASLSLCVCDFPHYWPFACGTITKWAFRWSLVRWDIVSDTERNGICTHEAIISTNRFSSSQVIPTHLKIRWRYVKSIPSDIFADDMSIYPFFGWQCMYFDWLSFPVGPIIKRFTLIQAMVWHSCRRQTITWISARQFHRRICVSPASVNWTRPPIIPEVSDSQVWSSYSSFPYFPRSPNDRWSL